MSENNTTGVQQLIDRLSDEGVAEGQRQAERIIAEARQQADDLLESARREASEMLRDARAQAEKSQAAGEQALQLAARDVIRDFGARMHDGFRSSLQALVHQEVQDPDLIKQMILEIAGQVGDSVKDQPIEILVPHTMVSEDEARRLAEAGESDQLMKFVEGLVGQRLREGVSVSLGRHNQSGVAMRVIEENVEIDLTDETITELLGRHMLPRFRSIMRSVH